MNAFYIFAIITILAWLIWAIGYPIYKKIKKEDVFYGTPYASVMCVLALFINIFNLLGNLVG